MHRAHRGRLEMRLTDFVISTCLSPRYDLVLFTGSCFVSTLVEHQQYHNNIDSPGPPDDRRIHGPPHPRTILARPPQSASRYLILKLLPKQNPRQPQRIRRVYTPCLSRHQQGVAIRGRSRVSAWLPIWDPQARAVRRVPRPRRVPKSDSGLLYSHRYASMCVDHSQSVPSTLNTPEDTLHNDPHFDMLMTQAPHCCHVRAVHVYFLERCHR